MTGTELFWATASGGIALGASVLLAVLMTSSYRHPRLRLAMRFPGHATPRVTRGKRAAFRRDTAHRPGPSQKAARPAEASLPLRRRREEEGNPQRVTADPGPLRVFPLAVHRVLPRHGGGQLAPWERLSDEKAELWFEAVQRSHQCGYQGMFHVPPLAEPFLTQPPTVAQYVPEMHEIREWAVRS